MDSRNLTRAETAQLFGKSGSTLHGWLRAQHKIPTEALNMIRDLLEDDRAAVLSGALPPLPRISRAYIKDLLRAFSGT
jgi:ParB-like chromosome segregation protein Spo0J